MALLQLCAPLHRSCSWRVKAALLQVLQASRSQLDGVPPSQHARRLGRPSSPSSPSSSSTSNRPLCYCTAATSDDLPNVAADNAPSAPAALAAPGDGATTLAGKEKGDSSATSVPRGRSQTTSSSPPARRGKHKSSPALSVSTDSSQRKFTERALAVPARKPSSTAGGGMENGEANGMPGLQHRRRMAQAVHEGEVVVKEAPARAPVLLVTRPLPRVLILHTGGTLGMDPDASYEYDHLGNVHLKEGTGGLYGGLKPGEMLDALFTRVPELTAFANLDLRIVFNKDSTRVGPNEWIQIAQILHKNRQEYDAFLVIHGTDTMAYTASALSLMLLGFRKPIVLTGSQLPLSMPRSDARQNIIDSITCATAYFSPPHVNFHEVAICFGGKLMRGNRCQKVHSNSYQAFDSPSYKHLATLGVNVEWNERYLLKSEGTYRPRFKLSPQVIRVPIVPGSDPRMCYGDLVERGVRGIVLEAFGVGNMPDVPAQGWMPWLRDQTKKGLQVCLSTQCTLGPLRPELYKSGTIALQMGVEGGPQMTPECCVVKMMLTLSYPDIPLGVQMAGEI